MNIENEDFANMYNLKPNVFMNMNQWKSAWAVNSTPRNSGIAYKGTEISKGTAISKGVTKGVTNKGVTKGATKGAAKSATSAKGKGKGKGRLPPAYDSILICVNQHTICVDPKADLGGLLYSCGPCR